MNRRGDSISNAALTVPLLPSKRKKRLTRPVLRHSAFFPRRKAFFLSQKERLPGEKDFFYRSKGVFIRGKERFSSQKEAFSWLQEVSLGPPPVVQAVGTAGTATGGGDVGTSVPP